MPPDPSQDSARWFLYIPVRVKSVTNGGAALDDSGARLAQRAVSGGGVESARASMRPERGAGPAGRRQSVTRGHRCPSFTLCSPSSMLPPIWQPVNGKWQAVIGRRGLPLTASHSGTSRGKTPTLASTGGSASISQSWNLRDWDRKRRGRSCIAAAVVVVCFYLGFYWSEAELLLQH